MIRPERRFWFFLARVFGCPVRILQKLIDGREFLEWMAYYRIEPFGDDWQQAARVAAATMQPWTKRAIDPESLIPGAERRAKRKPRKSTDAEILAGFRQLQAVQKAKAKHGNPRRAKHPPVRHDKRTVEGAEESSPRPG